MTNKYLEKIAAKVTDESDAAKAYARSSAASHVGYYGGAVAGGLGAALLASKSRGFRSLANRSVKGLKGASDAVRSTRLGKYVSKHVRGGGAAGVAGGLIGGTVGEEALNYASTRHSILQAKQDKKNGK